MLLRIANVYLLPLEWLTANRKWRRLARCFGALPAGTNIVAGDFNTVDVGAGCLDVPTGQVSFGASPMEIALDGMF